VVGGDSVGRLHSNDSGEYMVSCNKLLIFHVTHLLLLTYIMSMRLRYLNLYNFHALIYLLLSSHKRLFFHCAIDKQKIVNTCRVFDLLAGYSTEIWV
jgi:hypothetical protein